MVIIGPGFLVASTLGLQLRMLSTWAAIPIFSFASVFLLGEATMLIGVPFGPPAFAVVVVGLAVLAAFARSRRAPRSLTDRTARTERGEQHREGRLEANVDYGLLLLGIALGTSTWFRGLRSVPLVPPGGDATRHGWFVARIIAGRTIDPSKVLTSDVAGKHPIVHYYPLALHASAAISSRLAGADVGRVLIGYVVVFSAFVLPLGMFALARELAPNRPFIAGFTALVVPLMMLFPYYPVWGGDVPQIVAMSLVPIAVTITWRALRVRRPPTRTRSFVMAVTPAALAVFCIASLHTSELPLVVALALLVMLEQAWREHDVRIMSGALMHAAAVGVLATVMFAPTLVAFIHGVSERIAVRTFVVEQSENWGPSLGGILQLQFGQATVRQGFLALLAVSGAALWLMWRRPAWVAGWVAVALLSLFAAASTNPVADQLTFPWYHLESRIVPNLVFFVPFFAAVTLAYGARLITRMWRRPFVAVPAVATMVVLLAAFVGLHAVRANSAYVRRNFDPAVPRNQAVVSDTSLAAFRWLHAHVSRGDTVANEPNTDGSLWMYTLEHVSPLLGPYLSPKADPELTDRVYLLTHLQSLGRDRRADELAREFHTEWIYYDARVLLLSRRPMNLAALRTNRNLTAVFHEGGTWVFRVGRAT